jgi:hypothetical protein
MGAAKTSWRYETNRPLEGGMSFERAKMVALSGAMLIVGLIVGSVLPTHVLAGARTHATSGPNLIKFKQNRTSTKLSLLPTEGDIIDFFDANGNLFQPDFVEQKVILCNYNAPNHQGECEVQMPQYLTSVWNYDCNIPDASGNPGDDCFDPSIGPVSAKGQPTTGYDASEKSLRAHPVVPSSKSLWLSGKPSGTQTGTHVSKHPALRSVLTPSVSCVADGSGRTHLTVYVPGDATPDATLIAYPGDIIAWAPTTDFRTSTILDDDKESLCTSTGTFDENTACIVAKISGKTETFTYTVSSTSTTPSCGPSGTETVIVQAQ